MKVTPHNRLFKTRQVIVTYNDTSSAVKCSAQLPGTDVAAHFLDFNRDRTIFLYVQPGRLTPRPPAIPRPPPILLVILVLSIFFFIFKIIEYF